MSALDHYKPKRSGRRYYANSGFKTEPMQQGKPKAGGKRGGGKPYSKNSRVRYFGVLVAPDGQEYLIRKRPPIKPDQSGPKNAEHEFNRFGRRVIVVPDKHGRVPADLIRADTGVCCLTVWDIVWNGTRKGKQARARWSIAALWNSRDCDTQEVRLHPDTPHYHEISLTLIGRGIRCRYW